jgi:hypothetical protein
MVTTLLAAGFGATLTWNSCSEMTVKSVPGFSPEVADIIIKKCTPCHAGGKSEKGFGYVDKPALLIANGYITPGDSAGSLLYKKVSATPPYGDRMPKGGPYLNDAQLAIVANWIDTMEDPSGTKYSVAISASTGITTNPTGTASVGKNQKLAITVTPPSGVDVAQAVGGTCAAGTWSGSVYTTGKVTEDCSVVFTKDNEASVAIAGSVASSSEGDIQDIAFDLSSKIIEKGQTASFDFTVRANDTMDVNDEANLVSGTCAAGEITLLDAGTRRYRYTTGVISASCTVKLQTDIPCPDPSVSAPTFAGAGSIQTILGGGSSSTAKCTSCHYGSEQSVDFTTGAQGSAIEHASMLTVAKTATNGLKFVDAGKPLKSAMYLQVDPKLNFSGHMPDGGPYLNVTDRSKFCRWILAGAPND